MAERVTVRDFGKQINFVSSNRVDLGADFIGVTAISVLAWIKPKINASSFVVDNGKFQFYVTSTGSKNDTKIGLSSNGSTFLPTPNGSIVTDIWQCVAVSRTTDGTSKIYINGTERVAGSSGTPVAGLSNVHVGNRISDSARALKGNLDNLLIYKRVLTLQEIQDYYYRGVHPVDNGDLLYGSLFEDNANDISSYGRTATITGATFVTDPPLKTRTTATSRSTATNRVAVRDMGTALRFDGVDDYVRKATPLAHIVQNSPISFSFLFRTNDSADGTIFANRIDDTTGNLHFGWRNSSSRIEGAFFATGSIYRGRFASPRLNKNTWYHITIVYDGTTLNTGTNGVDIYVNGVIKPKVSTNFGGAGNGTNMTIGAQTSATPTNTLLCLLDEFRTWSRALTADEISNLYLYNIVPQDGLVAEYLFDEGAGTTALDTSGNGNDGTITGATYTTDTPLQPRTSV